MDPEQHIVLFLRRWGGFHFFEDEVHFDELEGGGSKFRSRYGQQKPQLRHRQEVYNSFNYSFLGAKMLLFLDNSG